MAKLTNKQIDYDDYPDVFKDGWTVLFPQRKRPENQPRGDKKKSK